MPTLEQYHSSQFKPFSSGSDHDTLSDKLNRQRELFSGLAPESGKTALKHIQEKPGEVLAAAGTGLLVAAGLAAAVKNPAVFGQRAVPLVKAAIEMSLLGAQIRTFNICGNGDTFRGRNDATVQIDIAIMRLKQNRFFQETFRNIDYTD
jgi:hypothetical protein